MNCHTKWRVWHWRHAEVSNRAEVSSQLRNDLKWLEMSWNEMKWVGMNWNELKWFKIEKNEIKWLSTVKIPRHHIVRCTKIRAKWREWKEPAFFWERIIFASWQCANDLIFTDLISSAFAGDHYNAVAHYFHLTNWLLPVLIPWGFVPSSPPPHCPHSASAQTHKLYARHPPVRNSI